VSENVQIYNCV